MIEFKKVMLSDKGWVRELLSYSGYQGCEYTFGNNFIWQSIYETKIARYKDFYLLKGSGGYFFPAGRGDFREAIEALRSDADECGCFLNFVTMNRASMQWLRENYPEYGFESKSDFSDYVYNYEDLAGLKGKKYHSKRNFINRFKLNQNWCYEPISERNIDECKVMNERWLAENDCCDRDLESENCAVRNGLRHFFELDFTGGLLRVDGEVIAFTFGEPVTDEMFVVHAEKAFTNFQGSYPTINNEFVTNALCGYKYINREEDMGLENLRKAKLSYNPAFMEEKFKAVIKASSL
jgi:hypothetical protein